MVIINRLDQFTSGPQVIYDDLYAGLRQKSPWAYWLVKAGDISVGFKGMELIDAVMWQLGIGEDEATDPKLMWVLSFLLDYFTPDLFFTLIPPVIAAARMMRGSLGDNLYYMLGIGEKKSSGRRKKSTRK